MKTKEKNWANLYRVMREYTAHPEDTIEAIKDLYSIYDEKIILWLGRLYDKDIGGFYCSNSARDNRPYLPNIESTAQVMNNLVSLGIIEHPSELPDEMKEGVKSFVCSLLDSEDGFIYHPQWGKNINDAKRGRDLNWAIQLSRQLDFKLPYKTANERLKAALEQKDTKAAEALPEHLRSAEALKKYLESYDWDKNAYFAGNNIASQMSSVVAAGLEDTAIEFLTSVQNPDTGLFGSRGSYGAINALLKISAAYNTANRPFNNAKSAAISAMECIIHEDDLTTPKRDEKCTTVCHIYNTWFSIRNLTANLRRFGGEEGAKTARDIICELYNNAPRAIKASKEKILRFKMADSSFTYDLEYGLKGFDQQSPSCVPYSREGGINSSVISTTGLTNNMYMALDIKDKDMVSIFDDSMREPLYKAMRLI